MSAIAGATYEPPIVVLLRRYVRRGAPASLLLRIAGGSKYWRQLNETWGIDDRDAGRAVRVLDARPVRALEGLSFAERRIALLQLAEEYAAQDEPLPGLKVLAGYFGVERERIAADILVLRKEGRLTSNSAGVPQRVAA